MAHLTGSIAVLVTALVTVSLAFPGGWSTKEPSSSPKYKELAHFAVAQRVEGLQNYDTVLELTKVETQVVAGVNYRLTFSIAATDCIIAEVEYNAERCPPKDDQVRWRQAQFISLSGGTLNATNEIDKRPLYLLQMCNNNMTNFKTCGHTAKATCTAVVYERPWQNVRSLTSLECA